MVTVTSRCDMLCSPATLGSVSLASMVDGIWLVAGLRIFKGHPLGRVEMAKTHQLEYSKARVARQMCYPWRA